MKFELNKAVEILSRTPLVVSGLLIGLSDEWIYSNEGKDTWSPFDVVGHLIHGEKTDWIPRTRIILSGGQTPFQPFDRFAQMEQSKDKYLAELLIEFKALREQNIDSLKEFKITGKELGMTGIHPELGPITLQQLLATWVVHDLTHINQISRTMAMQLKAEIGPWKAFFSLMRAE